MGNVEGPSVAQVPLNRYARGREMMGLDVEMVEMVEKISGGRR